MGPALPLSLSDLMSLLGSSLLPPNYPALLKKEKIKVERTSINPLMPNDDYSGRAAPLTSKRCILYIYSTNIGTECLKHGIYTPFFPLQNAVCFIILTYLVPVLFTFYIDGVLKLKNNSGAKRLKAQTKT